MIKELLAEQPGYRDIKIPEDTAEQRRLLRSPVNVRPPRRSGNALLASCCRFCLERGVGMNTPGIIKYPF